MEEKKILLNETTIDRMLELIDTAIHQRPYGIVRQVVEQVFREINQQKAEEKEIKSENK
jgi:hypothetical protein